jgi:hypothetical protein
MHQVLTWGPWLGFKLQVHKILQNSTHNLCLSNVFFSYSFFIETHIIQRLKFSCCSNFLQACLQIFTNKYIGKYCVCVCVCVCVCLTVVWNILIKLFLVAEGK